MIPATRVAELLEAAPNLTVGLVGDLFLDRYLEIAPNVQEMSIETGLEAYQVDRVRNSPGALGTILNNLAALGLGRLVPVTVIGDDGHGDDLVRAMNSLPIDMTHVIRDRERLTPTYTKPMLPLPSGERRELNRIDVRTRGPLSASTQVQVRRQLEDVFHRTAGLIVLDQIHEPNWGVVNADLRAWLVELAKFAPQKLVFIDSRSQIGHFRQGWLKPNRAECLAAVGESSTDPQAIPFRAAEELARRTGCPVFCTLSEQGLLVAQPGRAAVRVPALPVTGPIDPVGAGDSTTAGIVTALLAGADPVEAAWIGNLVASITIQQLGTTGTASPAQVLARCREYPLLV